MNRSSRNSDYSERGNIRSNLNLNDTDGYFQCSICFNPYDDKDRLARVMSCGHTFCKWCLERIAIHGEVHPHCPTCRKKTYASISNIPVNFQLMEVLERLGLVDSQDSNSNSPPASAELAAPLPGAVVRPSDDENNLVIPPEIYEQFNAAIDIFRSRLNRHTQKTESSRWDVVTGHEYRRKIRNLETCATYLDMMQDSFRHFVDSFERLSTDQEHPRRSETSSHDERFDFNADEDDFSEEDYDSDHDFLYEEDERQELFRGLSGLPSLIHRGDPIGNNAVDNNTRSRNSSSNEHVSNGDDSAFFFTTYDDGSRIRMKCRICECFVPLGGENLHELGRRHTNNLRRNAQSWNNADSVDTDNNRSNGEQRDVTYSPDSGRPLDAQETARSARRQRRQRAALRRRLQRPLFDNIYIPEPARGYGW